MKAFAATSAPGGFMMQSLFASYRQLPPSELTMRAPFSIIPNALPERQFWPRGRIVPGTEPP
jgi:hypothetical protein